MGYTTLRFFRTTKPRNNTGIVNSASQEFVCLIKEDSGVVHPKFKINFKSAEATKEFLSNRYNYCYWEDVSRYYYIGECTLITAIIVDINCEVDVLASFQKDIHNTNAFIQYAESSFNSMIPDSRLPISDRSNQYTVSSPTGLVNSSEGCFIVSIANKNPTGDFGPVQPYVMNKEQVVHVAEFIYSHNFFDEMAKFLLSPDDALIDCTWIPIDKAQASEGGDIPIVFGDFTLGTGAKARRTISGQQTIEPYIPYLSETTDENGNIVYSWADYRNCEPYTQYSIWLPGVGLTQIPMISLIGNGAEKPTFRVTYSLAVTTGDLTYTIERDITSSGGMGVNETVLTVKGNFGVPVPVAKHQSGYGGALNSFLAMTGSIVAMSVMPEIGALYGAIGAATSFGSGVIQVAQQSNSAVGALGGWATIEEQLAFYYMITRVFEVSDSPSNISSTIGRPLFKTKRLGDMKGLVKCTGAYVAADGASDEEQRLIAQYVNSSANFIFGGLIICDGNYGE